MKFEYKDLLEKKLISVKEYPDGKKILKYTKRVFWDNLWHVDERLLECRGLVLDKDDNIIVRPFKKVFNYGENGTTVPLDMPVYVVPKVNGFLGCVTKHKGEIIYSTTGSLDSDYVQMIKEMIPEEQARKIIHGDTYLFEICHPNDPHIIEEQTGAYLIGVRDIKHGSLCWQGVLNFLALPEWHLRFHEYMLFKDVLELIKECKHEGYVVYSVDNNEMLCKLKSPHYLTKKFLMRMSKGKVDDMFANPDKYKQTIDEEFYGIVDFIVKEFDKEDWKGYSDQQRRKVVEDYWYG